MKRLFNVRWIVFYLIALAAGILTAWVGLFYGKLLPLLLLSLSLPVMILSLAFLFWPVKRRIFLWIQAHALRILSVCLLLLVGYVSFNFQFIQVQNRSLPQGTYQVTGRISDLWTEDGGEYSVTGMILDRVSLNDGRSSFEIGGRVNAVFYGTADADLGDRITFSGSLSSLSAVYHGRINTSFLGSGVYYRATAQAESIAKLGYQSNLVIDLRKSFRSAMSESMSSRTFGMGYALIFGDKTYMAEGDYQTFRDIGVLHIFAVSGLHVGFILWLLNLILKKLSYRLRFVGVTLILTLYLFLCDFSPSVTRAVIMCIVSSFAMTIGASRDRLNIVSISGLVLLLINPFYLFDMGFLMSFTAVLSIVFLSVHFSRLLRFLPKKIAGNLAVTLSAQVGMLPVLMHYFGKIPLTTLLANLILVPFVELTFMILFTAALFAALIPQISAILVVPDYLLKGLLIASEWLADLNLGQVVLYSLGLFAVFYYAALLLVSDKIFLRVPWRAVGCLICSVILAAGYLWMYLPSPPDRNRILIPDIGYQSVLLELDSGQRIWIDLDAGEGSKESVLSYLRQKQISSLELLILPDCGEHALELIKELSREVSLGNIVVAETDELSELYLIEAIGEYAEVWTVRGNTSFRFAGQLFFLAESSSGRCVYTNHGGIGVLMGAALDREQARPLVLYAVHLVVSQTYSAEVAGDFLPEYYICNKYYGQNSNIYGLNQVGGLIFSLNHDIIRIDYDQRLYL